MKENAFQKHILKNPIMVCITAVFCCVLWGSAFPCIKIGYSLLAIDSADTPSQILFAGCRFTLAGFLSILLGSCSAGQLLRPSRSSIGKVLWLCLFQTVLQYFFFYTGLAHTSGVKASIITSFNVFITILVSGLVFHQERITPSKLTGCVIGFAGVVLVNLSGMTFSMTLAGEGAMFCSTFAYALSSVYLKRFSAADNPVMLSGYQFVFGGIILAIAGALLGGSIPQFTISGLLMLLYLAFVSAAAYSLWGLLLKYNPVSRVTVFGFMNPVSGVILSTLLLKEKGQASGMVSLVSLVLVCTGIYIVNRFNCPEA